MSRLAAPQQAASGAATSNKQGEGTERTAYPPQHVVSGYPRQEGYAGNLPPTQNGETSFRRTYYLIRCHPSKTSGQMGGGGKPMWTTADRGWGRV